MVCVLFNSISVIWGQYVSDLKGSVKCGPRCSDVFRKNLPFSVTWTCSRCDTKLGKLLQLGNADTLFMNIKKKNFYRKNPKNSDTPKNCSNYPKIRIESFYCRRIGPKDVDRIANSVDTDQTAPLGAVWSGTTLFAQTCLSKNLGTLGYMSFWTL